MKPVEIRWYCKKCNGITKQKFLEVPPKYCFRCGAEATTPGSPKGQDEADCSAFFTEHKDRLGVRLLCFDREYNFGKAAAEKMFKELAIIVGRWGDSK